MSAGTTAAIGFIGGGNMARAIIAGLLRAGHEPARLTVADPDAGQRRLIQGLDPRLRVGQDNAAAASGTDAIVLAVKPQAMAAVAGALPTPRPGQLVLSVAAGIRLEALSAWLGASTALVRVMPNQPALVGAGMSVMVGGGMLNSEQRMLAQYIMGSTGTAEWLDDESLLDAVTAISGSGPAYFYLLMEILAEAGSHMGIPDELARVLARQTAFGAGLAACETGTAPAELRRSVTSPGGTTAAAIETLEKAGVREMFGRALEAARRRSMELGNAASKG
jgi:pyrroline-5-carboxylate reductase